jgi:hypothetical protein
MVESCTIFMLWLLVLDLAEGFLFDRYGTAVEGLE